MNLNIKKNPNNKNFLTGMKYFFKKNGKIIPRKFRVNSAFVPRKAGFTLVELLVTISMFVIITGVILVNSNKFDSTVLLNNFTYDVALTIKQAQSYGVNVKESSSGSFNTAYGVYFDLTQSKTNFVLFNDVDDNKIYDGLITACPTDSVECIQKYSMTKGTYIQSICTGTSESNCNNIADQLSILFQRPNLNALIYSKIGSNPLSVPQPYAKIILAAQNGTATSTVVVTSVGQIYVKK